MRETTKLICDVSFAFLQTLEKAFSHLNTYIEHVNMPLVNKAFEVNLVLFLLLM
jgi:hypothetical protein